MKILHLSTFDRGGAGIAALRIHKAMLKLGYDSNFLCLNGNTLKAQNILQLPIQSNTSVLYRLKRRFKLHKTQKEKNQFKLNKYGGNYDYFSFPITDYRIEEHPFVKEADLINLHWISDFINFPTFFAKINKPICWTLHDCNPFLGGFHYRGDLERNKRMKTYDSTLLSVKYKVYEKINNLNLIYLADWIKDEIEKSPLKNVKTKKIYNGVNTEIFKPQNKEFAKDVLGFDPNKKHFLFVADDLTNKRKGIDLFLDIAANLKNENVCFIALGNKTFTSEFENIETIEFLKNERLISLLYNAVDGVIIPSREDNLPNIMVESLLCGTPVFSFKIGGMKEIIKPGINGDMADEISSNELTSVLKKAISNLCYYSQYDISENAKEHFTDMQQAEKYIQFYKELI